jgi:hypothetical protein
VGFLEHTEVAGHAVNLRGGKLGRLGKLDIWLTGLDIGGRLVDVVDEHRVSRTGDIVRVLHDRGPSD